MLEVAAGHLRAFEDASVGDDVRRAWIIIDLALTYARGFIADGVLLHGFKPLDRFEFREWLRRHGAHDQAVQSAVVQAFYDASFSYADGRVDLPNVAAGVADSRHPPDRLRLPRARRLQDERGHGRHDLRADLRGVEAPRRHVQVLPPRHGARTRHRSRDERQGHRPRTPGSTSRPRGPGVRAAGPGERSAVLALDAADRPNPERRSARRCQSRVALERLAGRGHRDARGRTRLRRAGPGDLARRPAAHLPVLCSPAASPTRRRGARSSTR